MTDRFSCARTSEELAEPVFATASQVQRWILVEQPGAWGSDALAQSGLDTAVARGLGRAARAARARLVLIRRHGRSSPARRSCFAVTSTAGTRRTERLEVDDPAELTDIDWTPLRRGEPVGGQVGTEPLYLVCTHGSHDACCARFGRPVAQALAADFGDAVWEVSHVGGDRFAGNLVCLPDGIYYGRVTPHSARQLVESHQRGHLDLDHLRGRSFLSFTAQAADHLVRTECDLTGIDDVLPQRVRDLGGGRFVATVAIAGDRQVTATLACEPADQAQQLTCNADVSHHPPRYRLVSLQELPAGAHAPGQ